MEYEKYLYDTEQMKADVRTYIALGINWVRYHNSLAKDNNEKKKDKITNIVNEDILKAWDKIDYFEKATGKDIFSAIPDLNEDEKQFIKKVNDIYYKKIQEKILPKNFDTYTRYIRNDIGRIYKAKGELKLSKTNEDIKKLNDYIEERYINLGGLTITYFLQPYLNQFTHEEQQYINDGRMAKIGSEYAEGAEKARKFLKTSTAFKKVGDRITQVGVDFNKAMTEKGEELGDKVRQAGVKLSPLIINLGEDVIEFTDNLDIKKDVMFDNLQDKKDTMFDNLQDKIDDVFAKRIWREIKKHINKECLKIVPNAPEKAIEIKAKDVYFQSRDYILNEYPTLKQKAEEIRENYIQHNGQDINEEEFQAYLSTQIPDYEKYKNFTKYYNDYYDIFVRRTYEYVNS